jgi:hypothetical protein
MGNLNFFKSITSNFCEGGGIEPPFANQRNQLPQIEPLKPLPPLMRHIRTAPQSINLNLKKERVLKNYMKNILKPSGCVIIPAFTPDLGKNALF